MSTYLRQLIRFNKVTAKRLSNTAPFSKNNSIMSSGSENLRDFKLNGKKARPCKSPRAVLCTGVQTPGLLVQLQADGAG